MGRLQRHKNVQTILRAIAQIDLSGWMVDVLGDGHYRKELEKLVSELGLTDHVKFYGWIDNGSKEQLYYLKRASVYITASYFENCPMAVIETIAAGCYPLLSDIPAHRQLVPENEYYFEADEISSDGIAISKYDWERVISQYEEVLCLASERKV